MTRAKTGHLSRLQTLQMPGVAEEVLIYTDNRVKICKGISKLAVAKSKSPSDVSCPPNELRSMH